MSDVRAKALLDELYAELPAIDCQRKCESSCGPIAMSRGEWQRIIKRKGFEPRATSIDCPLLDRGLCSVYAIRPMICRLWGVIETMPCPWGCKPERYLSTREGYIYLARADLLSAESDEEREAAEAYIAELETMSDERIAVSELLHATPRIQ